MQCLACNHKNTVSLAYCQKCGSKMDFTADEITGALVEKARQETADATEHHAKQALTLGVALFLLSITLFFLSRGEPEAVYALPSHSMGAKHVEVENKSTQEIPKLVIPIEFRKR